jgi:hypothetical protein
MEMPEIFVGTFSDALAEAAAMVDEFGRAFVGYVLDARGQVTSGWALTADFHEIADVVLLVLAGDPPDPGTGVLLLSAVVGSDVMTVREEDELRWGSFRRVFAARGYHLWDWIKADGEGFRSLYLGTDGAGAWPAPAVRSSD